MPINGINGALEAQKIKKPASSEYQSLNQCSASGLNQTEVMSKAASQSITNLRQVNFGAARTTQIASLSFAGNSQKNDKQYMHIMAEMAPIAKTGGEAVVGQDLACMYPKFNNSRHVFILPYYNGQEQTAPGTKFITGYEIRKEEDGTPFYCTPNNINNPKEHYKLEKVAEKEIEWGQETALTGNKIKVELYKVDPAALQNKSIPKESEVYLVYAPMTACLEKEYGVAYHDGNLGNSYSQFCRAAAELVPELNKPEYGNFNPKNVLCHDWHTSFFLNDANKKAAEGDDYFKGIQPGYVIHNLGRSYQGISSPYALFCQVATPEEIKAVNEDPEFQKLALDKFRISSQPLSTHVDVDKDIAKYFEKIMPELVDETGAFNASMIPLQLAQRGWHNIHTVSSNFADELVNTPELSEGLTKKVAQLQEKGSFVGIVNGMSSPNCDSTKKVGYGPGYQHLDTFSPSDDVDHIVETKRENKRKVYEKILAYQRGELGSLKDSQVEGVYKPGDEIIGYLDPKVLDDLDAPLFIGWGRGDIQKGMDISLEAIQKFAKDNPKAIFMLSAGVNSKDAEAIKVKALAEELANGELKGRLLYFNGIAPVNALSSGADFSIFTSRFEPCGLTQFESMKYGCIPIVSSTGGFASTVLTPYETDEPNGYKSTHSFYMPKETLKEKFNLDEIDDKDVRKYRDTALAHEIADAMQEAVNESKEDHNQMILNGLNAKTGWDNNHQFNDGESALERIQKHHFEKMDTVAPKESFVKLDAIQK